MLICYARYGDARHTCLIRYTLHSTLLLWQRVAIVVVTVRHVLLVYAIMPLFSL